MKNKIGLLVVFAAVAVGIYKACQNTELENSTPPNRDRLLALIQAGFANEDYEQVHVATLDLAKRYGTNGLVENCIAATALSSRDIFGYERTAKLVENICVVSPKLMRAEIFKSFAGFLRDNQSYDNQAWGSATKILSNIMMGAGQVGTHLGQDTIMERKRAHDHPTNWVTPTQFLARYREPESIKPVPRIPN